MVESIIEWLKKKGQAVEADVTLCGVSDNKVLMTSYVKDITSQGKSWIYDSASTVHVCFEKELFNSLDAKKKRAIKMVDDSTSEVISTRTVKVTEEMGQLWAV